MPRSRRRRRGRTLLNALTGLSLVLCLATVVFWVRSYWGVEVAALARGSVMSGVTSCRGSLLIWRSAASQRSGAGARAPILLYGRAEDRPPWWLGFANAGPLVTELGNDLRAVSGAVGEGLRSMEDRPNGWAISSVYRIGPADYLTFEAELDCGVRTGDVLTVVRLSPAAAVASLQVDFTDPEAPEDRLRRLSRQRWGYDGDLVSEDSVHERREREPPRQLSAIGRATWAGGAVPPALAQLYAVRGRVWLGVDRQFSVHGLSYVRGWAWGQERTLLAVPHWVVAVAFGTLSLPAIFSARRALVRRARLRSGRCVDCGYSLTGNASGTCPECGTPVTVAAAAVVSSRPCPVSDHASAASSSTP